MNQNYWVVILLIAFTAIASFACGTPKDAKTTDGDTDTPVVTGDTKTDAPDPMDELIANIRKGFGLFKDPTLAGSTNGMSCQGCHPYGGKDPSEGAMAKGTLIGKAETFPKKVEMTFEMLGEVELTLYEMINFCITNPLKGKELAEDDPAMVQLTGFLEVLKPKDFDAVVLPIIHKSCSPCHVENGASQIVLTERDNALSALENIRGYVESGRMPKGGTLSDIDYLTLIIWATDELDQKM